MVKVESITFPNWQVIRLTHVLMFLHALSQMLIFYPPQLYNLGWRRIKALKLKAGKIYCMTALILEIISLKINRKHKCWMGIINEKNVFISVEFCTYENFVK